MASITATQGIEMLKDSRLGDFSITVGSSRFPVHKIVLQFKSDFFNSCINGSFQADQSAVHIKETSPFIVALLLLYVYTQTLDLVTLAAIWQEYGEDIDTANESDMELFKVYMEVYQLADRLMMVDMTTFVGEKIVTLALNNRYSRDSPNTGVEMLKRIYGVLSHTDRTRVNITIRLVQKHPAINADAAKLVQTHEPAAWEAVRMQ